MTDAHLDDEILSAALDGEIDATTRTHLDACTRCAGRLRELRIASAAIATPVPAPPSGAIDAAVATALGRPRLAPTRRFRPVPLLAAAAVLVAILVAVPLLARDGGDNRETAARSRETAPSLAAGADLGALDANSLRAAVESHLGSYAAAAAPAPQAKSAPAAGGTSAAGDTTASAAAPKCETTLHRDTPAVLDAAATWEGTPARVLAFREGDDVAAYVIDPADCRILHFARFRPRS